MQALQPFKVGPAEELGMAPGDNGAFFSQRGEGQGAGAQLRDAFDRVSSIEGLRQHCHGTMRLFPEHARITSKPFRKNFS